MPDIPPNMAAALTAELAGLEARLARADAEQRTLLEARISTILATLGVSTKRTQAGGRQTRPDTPPAEARG